MNGDFLEQLYNILVQRKTADPSKSYVSSLYKDGSKKIAEKIREEAEETIIESDKLEADPQNLETRTRLKSETADLLFHVMVMLAYYELPPELILQELQGRFGKSGHLEKASRNK